MYLYLLYLCLCVSIFFVFCIYSIFLFWVCDKGFSCKSSCFCQAQGPLQFRSFVSCQILYILFYFFTLKFSFSSFIIIYTFLKMYIYIFQVLQSFIQCGFCSPASTDVIFNQKKDQNCKKSRLKKTN